MKIFLKVVSIPSCNFLFQQAPNIFNSNYMYLFTCEGRLQPYRITALVKTNTLKTIITHRPSTTWKVFKYRVFSGPYFLVFGPHMEIYCVNFCILSGYGKIRTRKNAAFGHFSDSVAYSILNILCLWRGRLIALPLFHKIRVLNPNKQYLYRIALRFFLEFHSLKISKISKCLLRHHCCYPNYCYYIGIQ